MNEHQPIRAAPASIIVIGAGVAGAWQALLFAERGCEVDALRARRRVDDASHRPWRAACWRLVRARDRRPSMTRLGLRRSTVARRRCRRRGSTARWWWRSRATAPTSSVSTALRRRRDWRVDADEHRRARTRSRRPLPPRRCSSRDEAHLDPREALPALARRAARGGVAVESASASSWSRGARRHRHRLPRPRRARRAARPARRQGRDDRRRDARDRAGAARAHAASAHPALHRAARRRPVS